MALAEKPFRARRLALAIGLGAALVIANRVAWQVVSALFDRECLIASIK